MQAASRQEILNRLHAVERHVRVMARMVEEEQSCLDVLRKSFAAQSGLDHVPLLLLRHHMHTCVSASLARGTAEARERTIRELLELCQGAASLGRQAAPPIIEDTRATGGAW